MIDEGVRMTAILDSLALLACLFGSLWCWRGLRRLGLGRLAAAALTCLALYLALIALAALGLLLLEAWRRSLDAVSNLVVPIGLGIGTLFVGIACWTFWAHRRARRFFQDSP
jgi:hypothetical protein